MLKEVAKRILHLGKIAKLITVGSSPIWGTDNIFFPSGLF